MESLVNSSTPWRTGKIMRVSIAVSILVHFFLILGFQKTFQWPGIGEETRTYRVELLRPPIENIGGGELTQDDLTQINKEQQEKTQQQDQETISLDTKDKRYVSYAGVIKERIAHHWQYPPQAKENLIEGKLVLVFSLNREGGMLEARIITPSGFEILDKEAVRAVTMAAPFPPFPADVTVARLNVVVNFDYRLTARK